MKSLIIFKSIHQDNTKKIAQVMADELGADLKEVSKVSQEDLKKYDLIGLGSGIYMFKHHRSLFKLVKQFPKNKKVFIFSTSGDKKGKKYHKKLRKALKDKGCKIIGEFNCPGFDNWGPLKLIGGTNKGRPNDKDIKKAQSFVKNLA